MVLSTATTYKSYSRGVSALKAHLVLVTKSKKKVIDAEILQTLEEIIKDLCERWGCNVIEFNGEADYIHLLFGYYPQMQLSKFINNLKTVTSRMIRKEFAEKLSKVYWKPVFWTNSYFIASCGGVTVEHLKQYINSQNSPVDT